MSRLRSLLFAGWFFLFSTVLAIAFVALTPLPRRAMMKAIKLWSVLVMASLRLIVGVKVEIRGREHRPSGPALVAAKHQGMFDFIGPFDVLPDACFVLKKELLRIPLFGWHCRKTRMIPIDREGHARALKDMVREARDRLRDGRQVIIFPEGTRKAPGAAPDYKPGVAAIYRELELPCTPMATNSGVHWPARGFPGKPGTIVFEFLPPIPAGLKRAEFMRELETRIETASTALLAEGL
jgi:1-acyl-sn-glycerol-3-phosphate acyltransferase